MKGTVFTKPDSICLGRTSHESYSYRRISPISQSMMVKRETEKMNTLLNIDDFFSDNIPWQEHFLGRMDTVRMNLNTIGRLIASYPKTSKLAIVHKRLTEDLDDAFAKYNQAINKRGSENMMRNDEREPLGNIGRRPTRKGGQAGT